MEKRPMEERPRKKERSGTVADERDAGAEGIADAGAAAAGNDGGRGRRCGGGNGGWVCRGGGAGS